MSAAMLARRQSLALGASRSSTRAFVSVSRPKPFSPARKVFVRAAPEAGDSSDNDVDELMEGEDFVEGELLDALVLDDDEVVSVELDEEALAAVAAAEEFVVTYDDELIVEADLGGDENSPSEGVAAKADGALDKILSATSASDAHLEAALALAGGDVQDAEEVHDEQGPRGFRKYDEDESSGVSEDQRAEVAAYKLTKTELENLVPEGWDTINIDWFSNRKEEDIPLPEYKLNFIWTERNIAVAVDQVYSRGQVSPLTDYFFWPRKDAWEELRVALEARPWISERDKVILLNRTTEVINFWQQDGEKPTVEAVRAAFPDCSFMGTDTPVAPAQMAMSA